MKRIVATRLTLLAALLLSGCAASGPITDRELAANDFGVPCDQAAGERIIRDYLNRTLRDYDSAKVQIGPITKGRMWLGATNGGNAYGYTCDVNVNAKNGFGGYEGWGTWKFLIRDGAIVQALRPGTFHGLIS